MTRPRRLAPHTVRARLTALPGRLTNPDTAPAYTDVEFAEAVDAVIAPRGWELLRKPPASDTARANVALYMATTVKAALEAKARAEAAAEAEETGMAPRDPGTVLGEVIDQGFQRFLQGQFVPDRPVKKPRGKGPAIVKANLNVRVDQGLRDQVAELCPARSVELGWTVTPGMVAMAWLFSEYGITEDDQIGVTTPAV
ncbi:hypothetical protein ACFC08_28435 [Streptomyces sp. NPDC056112]|uniref:hypothetical protein n=1 Tax=Streptomyces sp. NPDC056112 TaxID=3345715 RepID=UPI0035DB9617